MNDNQNLSGHVFWEIRDELGNLKSSGESRNIITDTGDTLYSSRGAGLTTTLVPTGMQLGTASTAAAKNGAGSFIAAYLDKSDHTFDNTPTVTTPTAGQGSVVTYKSTYAAGEATSVNPITEAAIVNKTLVANGVTGGVAGTAGQTIARVILTGIGSKGASDTLTLTWQHTIRGQ